MIRKEAKYQTSAGKTAKNTKFTINAGDLKPFGAQYIVELYYKAVSADTQQLKLDWYQEARRYAQGLADDFNITLRQAVDVIAALSPLREWELNKKMARIAVESWRSGVTPLPNVHMYKKNSEKAYAILNNLKYKLGIKTETFAANILGDYNRVTVDTITLMTFFRLGMYPGTFAPSDTAYRLVERMFQKAAKVIGIAPAMLQAVLWEFVRKIRTKNSSNAYNKFWESATSLLNLVQMCEAQERLNFA